MAVPGRTSGRPGGPVDPALPNNQNSTAPNTGDPFMPIELLWVGGVLVAGITTLIVALLPDKRNSAPPHRR